MPRLSHWKESRTVSALSDFLKANQEHGISLVILDRRPALHFEPGLVPGDGKRWEVARKAVGLLFEAKDDIKELANNQLLKVPPHPGYGG